MIKKIKFWLHSRKWDYRKMWEMLRLLVMYDRGEIEDKSPDEKTEFDIYRISFYEMIEKLMDDMERNELYRKIKPIKDKQKHIKWNQKYEAPERKAI